MTLLSKIREFLNPPRDRHSVVTFDDGVAVAIPRENLVSIAINHEHIKWRSRLTEREALNQARHLRLRAEDTPVPLFPFRRDDLGRPA